MRVVVEINRLAKLREFSVMPARTPASKYLRNEHTNARHKNDIFCSAAQSDRHVEYMLFEVISIFCKSLMNDNTKQFK